MSETETPISSEMLVLMCDNVLVGLTHLQKEVETIRSMGIRIIKLRRDRANEDAKHT
jgi:hypothetical protein